MPSASRSAQRTASLAAFSTRLCRTTQHSPLLSTQHAARSTRLHAHPSCSTQYAARSTFAASSRRAVVRQRRGRRQVFSRNHVHPVLRETRRGGERALILLMVERPLSVTAK